MDSAEGADCKSEMAGAVLGSVASAVVTVGIAVGPGDVVTDGTIDGAADSAEVSMLPVGDACVVEVETLPHEASATVMPSASPKADSQIPTLRFIRIRPPPNHSARVSHVTRVTECRTRCGIS